MSPPAPPYADAATLLLSPLILLQTFHTDDNMLGYTCRYASHFVVASRYARHLSETYFCHRRFHCAAEACHIHCHYGTYATELMRTAVFRYAATHECRLRAADSQRITNMSYRRHAALATTLRRRAAMAKSRDVVTPATIHMPETLRAPISCYDTYANIY